MKYLTGKKATCLIYGKLVLLTSEASQAATEQGCQGDFTPKARVPEGGLHLALQVALTLCARISSSQEHSPRRFNH